MTMTEGICDFMGYDPHNLRLTAQVGEAVSCWLRAHHKRDAAKNIARNIGCDVRTAENILQGHLSGTTLTKLLAAYGWPFLAGIGAAVIGETYEQAIERELEDIANARRQLDEAERRARGSWARVRARGSVDRGALRLVSETDGNARREAR